MDFCEYLEHCPFFVGSVEDVPSIMRLQKRTFCLDNPSMCARYLVREKLGQDSVPLDFFPTDMEKAKSLTL